VRGWDSHEPPARLCGWIGPAVSLALLMLAGCATPIDEGERLYRAGDRRGALEAWSQISAGNPDYAAVADRVVAVEKELQTLFIAYAESAQALEAEGRIAEAILDYRLALELEPDDASTLAHVQRLARDELVQKAQLQAEYEKLREKNDLEAAAVSLEKLRALDPFDPTYETEQLDLKAATREKWRKRQVRYRKRLAGEAESLIEQGRAAFRDEKLDEALDSWRRALLLDPENERVQAYIARAERQLESLERLRSTPQSESPR
jgi:tetratricopeptide (TPR) repeat protein